MTIGQNQTLADWLAYHSETRPDAIALDADGTQVSYAELARDVAGLISGLAGLSIGKDDVVGAQMPNLRAYVTAFLAVTGRGAIFQTLHMPYRTKELRMLLKDAGAKAVIVTDAETDSRTDDVLAVKADLPKLESVISLGPDRPETVNFTSLATTEPNPADKVETTTEDPFLLLFTSGTTAAPKGVPHIYRSFLDNAYLSANEMKLTPDDRVLSLAPLTHLYGLCTLHMALAAGATTVLIPAFNPQTLIADLETAQATHVFSAPAHFAPFVAQNALNSDTFDSVRVLCLSGTAVPVSLAKAMDALMKNGSVIQLWGMSELQIGTFTRPYDPEEKRQGSAGRAIPGTELRALGDDGSIMPAGEEGALEVRGPSVFAGYLNRPDETAKSFDGDGWFKTGDLAIIDGDGYLTITGRTKEIINRGGVKYNPVEVEEVLVTLPQVMQCAIVPVPDPTLGERGCLCVQLTPNSTLALEDATAALAQAGMAKYKWPEKLVIVDELPMTPTRKVMRGTLSQMVQKQKE